MLTVPMCVQDLIRAIEASADVGVAEARHLLGSASVRALDLAPWADFDHPRSNSYGRRLLHEGQNFELMVMSWNVGDFSAIHDHGRAEWGAVRLFGHAEHAIFSLEAEKLRTASRTVLPPNTVLGVSHDLIHQMGNRDQPPFLSLHLYGVYDNGGGITSDARIYNLDEQVIQFTDNGIFFNLSPDLVKRTEPAPQADFPTWLRYQVEVLRRLTISLSSGQLDTMLVNDIRRRIGILMSKSTWIDLDELAATLQGGQYDLLITEARSATQLLRLILVDDLAGPSMTAFQPTIAYIDTLDDDRFLMSLAEFMAHR